MPARRTNTTCPSSRAGSLGFVYPGVHGLAAEQQWAGLFAPVLIEDGNEALAGYETHTMVIKDLAVSGSVAQSHLFMSDFMYGKEGSIVTVNGQINPVLSVKRGQVQRWHIVNASNARFYRLYLENHVLYLIGTDGGLLDRPYTVSTLVLAPGERADVLVKATTAQASSRLISLPYTRQTANGAGDGPHRPLDVGPEPQQPASRLLRSGHVPPGHRRHRGLRRRALRLRDRFRRGRAAAWAAAAPAAAAAGTDRGLYGTGTFGGQNPAAYAYWPAVTELLGMTTAEILDELAKGKSLADIGRAQGHRRGRAQPDRHRPKYKSNLTRTWSRRTTSCRSKADQELAFALPIVGVAMTTKGSASAQQRAERGLQPVHVRPAGLLRRLHHVVRVEQRWRWRWHGRQRQRHEPRELRHVGRGPR